MVYSLLLENRSNEDRQKLLFKLNRPIGMTKEALRDMIRGDADTGTDEAAAAFAAAPWALPADARPGGDAVIEWPADGEGDDA